MNVTAPAREDTSSPSSPNPEGSGALPKNIGELKAKRDARGVKSGATRGKYNKGAREPGAAPVQMEAPIPVFTPESLRPLVCLPFDLAFTKTRYTGFPLTDNEASTLSHTGAMVANQWVQIDPKWVALITFGLSLVSITSAKIVGYRMALLAVEEEKAKKLAEEKAGTPA